MTGSTQPASNGASCEPAEDAAAEAAVTGREWSLPCGCTYQPGIDLPITECVQHAADSTLVHRPACTRHGCGRPWSEHDYGTFCP